MRSLAMLFAFCLTACAGTIPTPPPAEPIKAQRAAETFLCGGVAVDQLVDLVRSIGGMPADQQLQDFAAWIRETEIPRHEDCQCRLALLGESEAAQGRVSGQLTVPAICHDSKAGQGTPSP